MALINQLYSSKDFNRKFKSTSRIYLSFYYNVKHVRLILSDITSKTLISLFADFYLPLKH